jgi:class 3 adenylate cyclase/predicted ATPase
MDVGGWLRSLGLEQYEAAFRENAITETLLPSLTAEDLKDLGVGIVGHRRTLLNAITTLRAEASTKAPLSDAVPTIDRTARDAAERRQVTVMFSDLVGSTALSARMDPEDLREVISAYQKCVAETVRRFGGFVAKFLGDGVLVYFGYPQAHEDDAERAVLAGLELIGAVAALKTHAPLQTRVGVATGLVVVGDLIGSGEAQERSIVGETPNLAARLQALAEPDMVVIAEATRKLLGDLFELADLGPKDLKGIAGPVRAWAVLRRASVESRFEALHATGLTALVGREEEIELLLRRWSRAKAGEGQVVLLSGEAGIGKSRLTAALIERLAPEPHTRLRYFCSPQHTDSAFFPIISQVERAARLARDDSTQVKLEKLDALLAQSSTSPNDVALLAKMLSLPNDGRYPALELVPEQRRQKTLEALVSQVEALARQNPVLMIFEDAHWSDPTSLEVFSRAVDRIRTLRVLLLVTFRPEFEAPWTGQPHVTALTINRLTQRDVIDMIDRVVGNNLLPATVRQDIIERTDGIPLFVEEMTKAVLEAESEGEAWRTAAAVPSPALAVPASLHASLMARLDRLGSAKEVAQIGAAIGREFSHALLAAVVGKPEAELGSALDRLIAAGLLFRQGVAPHATYLFKHALVQDAAYGTLLRDQRRALHRAILQTFESQFAELAEVKPELLAHHATESGQIEKAAKLWGKAGQRSLEHSALAEAVEQLKRAVGLIETLPSTPELRRERIKLQVALPAPLMHLRGHAAPETMAACQRAYQLISEVNALGEPIDDPLQVFAALFGIWVANVVAFNGEVVCKLAAEFLSLAGRQEESTPLMIGHRMVAFSLLLTGNPAQGLPHYNQALALYDPIKHRSLALTFAQDARVATLVFRALVHWTLGYPDTALIDANLAVTHARETGLAGTQMYCIANAIISFFYAGEFSTASALVDELISLAGATNSTYWKASTVVYKGWLLSQAGDAAGAVHTIASGIAAHRATGATVYIPLFIEYLAAAHLELDQFDIAKRLINEAIVVLETTKEGIWEAEAYRVAGEIERKSPDRNVAKAEEYFQQALSTARRQQAKSFELRASMSLARLWRGQGKAQQARELLAPVYGWFTEGFDTRDLKQAKALLDELASRGNRTTR